MNLYQIDIFISIAKHLNFTRAAEDFNTSQPTISRQLGMLEEEWGFPLFTRLPHVVRLTPEGVIMLRTCMEMKKKLESGLREVSEVREGKTGNIRIGFLEAMDTALFVEPTASYFSRRFPGIDISLEKHSFAGLRNGLASGELDIIFTLDFEARVIQDIAYNTYYPVQAVFLMRRQHPLASKEDLKPIDFAEETFFTTEALASTGQIEEFRGICRNNGFECKRILTVKNQGSVLLHVRSGKGVALADTSLVNINDKNLYSYLILPKETAPMSVIYAWKIDNLNPAVALYINTLMDSGPIDIYNA